MNARTARKLAAVGCCLLATNPLYAGDGRIVGGVANLSNDCGDHECQDDPHGDGVSERTGDVILTVAARFIPSLADVTHMKERLVRANQILCDATDGNVRLRKIHLVASDPSSAQADLWWYPAGVFTSNGFPRTRFPNARGRFGDEGARSVVSWGTDSSSTIAHELGHHILRLGEGYERQWSLSEDNCGIGPIFDGVPVVGTEMWRAIPTASPFFTRIFPESDDFLWNTDLANTLMNTSLSGTHRGQCVTPDGLLPEEYDPVVWEGVSQSCVADVGCSGYGPFTVCGGLPPLRNELSTVRNFDATVGTFDSGALDPEGPSDCPIPQASELVFQGRLRPDSLPTVGDSDGDGDSWDANEECSGSLPTAMNSCWTPGLLSCYSRGVLDERPCGLPPTASCGDGNKDEGEVCDDGGGAQTVIPCASVSTGFYAQSSAVGGKPLTGGVARCIPAGQYGACRYDLSECTVADAGTVVDGEVNLSEEASSASGEFILPDSLGNVGFVYGDTSVHSLFVRATRTGAHEWVLALYADEETFAFAPSAGDQLIAAYLLEFGDGGFSGPAGQLMRINGRVFDSDNPPQLLLGSDSISQAPFGTMPYSNLPAGQNGPTGAFQNGAPEMGWIDLRFGEIKEEFWETPDGARTWAASFIRGRARAGVVQSGILAGKEIPPGSRCNNQVHCALSWNSETHQYETSDNAMSTFMRRLAEGETLEDIQADPRAGVLSEWEKMQHQLMTYNEGTVEACDDGKGECLGVYIPLPISGRVVPSLNPEKCPDPVFEIEPTITAEQVVLALDRSGSMRSQVGVSSVGASRLDVAKAAGRVFTAQRGQAILAKSLAPEVALTWFNHEVGQVPEGVEGLKKLISEPTSDSDSIEVATLDGEMRDSEDPDGEYPEPEGRTTIAGALNYAGDLLPGDLVGRAVLLLSDTFETVEPGAEEAAAQKLRDDGIRIYTVMAGLDGDKGPLVDIAGKTGGESFDATDETEIPGAFFEFSVLQQGQSLARHHTAPEEVVLHGGSEIPTYSAIRKIEVEPGARKLEVLVWTRTESVHASAGSCQDSGGFTLCEPATAGYEPDVTFRDPNGDLVTPEVREDTYFRYFIVPNPDPGTWEVREYLEFEQESGSWVAAFVDNPDIRCEADLSARIVGEDRNVTIFVSPTDIDFVAGGAEIDVRLRRPDGSIVSMPVEYDSYEHAYVGKISESLFIGRGAYQAIVRCDVPEGTPLEWGEQLEDLSEPRPTNPGASRGFVRETSAGFFLDVAQLPPLRPGGDCDKDGIPDGNEPPGDFDGDGLPNVCDADADNDDVPDGIDDTIQKVCEPDSVPPTIQLSGAIQISTCNPDPQEISFPQPTVEDVCSEVTLTGQLVATGSKTLGAPVALAQNASTFVLPGTTTIRWMAQDQAGNITQLSQDFEIVYRESVECCDAGMTILEGTSLQDSIVPATPDNFCVLSYELGDYVLTSSGADKIWGGSGADYLNGGSGTDWISGGDGEDMVNCGYGGVAEIHAGAGQDYLQLVYCSGTELWGGSGADSVSGSPGSDLIYPGTGVDSVAAGDGDDRVVLFDLCEATPGKILDGGSGNDTLVAPVDQATLEDLGVTVLGFENIVIDVTQNHLAECF